MCWHKRAFGCRSRSCLLTWYLQSFSQDCNLFSHITCIVCINFINEWRDLSFKVVFKRSYLLSRPLQHFSQDSNLAYQSTFVLGFNLSMSVGNFCAGTKKLSAAPHDQTCLIGIYNPLVRTATYFLTPLIWCALILLMSGGTYRLKSPSNDRFLRKFSCTFYIFFKFSSALNCSQTLF